MIPAVPDTASGSQLRDAIFAYAEMKGLTVSEAARPIGGVAKLLEIARAAQPRLVTVRKVQALLRGAEMPPSQPCSTRVTRDPTLDHARIDLVDRDPCFKCGVRGDIGCGHRRRRL